MRGSSSSSSTSQPSGSATSERTFDRTVDVDRLGDHQPRTDVHRRPRTHAVDRQMAVAGIEDPAPDGGDHVARRWQRVAVQRLAGLVGRRGAAATCGSFRRAGEAWSDLEGRGGEGRAAPGRAAPGGSGSADGQVGEHEPAAVADHGVVGARGRRRGRRGPSSAPAARSSRRPGTGRPRRRRGAAGRSGRARSAACTTCRRGRRPARSSARPAASARGRGRSRRRAAAACIAGHQVLAGPGPARSYTRRTISRRSSRLSLAHQMLSHLRQGNAKLGQTAAPGRADAPDRHAQVGRESCVVGTVLERHDPQQPATALGQPVDGGPQPVPRVVLDGDRLGRPLRRAAAARGPRRRPGSSWRRRRTPATPRGGRSWSASHRRRPGPRWPRAGVPAPARWSG